MKFLSHSSLCWLVYIYFSLSVVCQDSPLETKSQLQPVPDYREMGRQTVTKGMAPARLVKTKMCVSDMILSNYGDESAFGEEEVKGDQDNEVGSKDKIGEGEATVQVQLIKEEIYKSVLGK